MARLVNPFDYTSLNTVALLLSEKGEHVEAEKREAVSIGKKVLSSGTGCLAQ